MSIPVFALLLAAAATHQEATGEVSWAWAHDTQSCALQQHLDPATASIEVSRTPGNDETGIEIKVRSASTMKTGRLNDGTIRLEPGGDTVGDIYASNNDGKIHISAVTRDPTFMQKLSGAAVLEVQQRGRAVARVALRAADAAAKALEICENEKMREWGIDPIAWRGLKVRPLPLENLRDRFSEVDYPLEALRFAVAGDSLTRLDVAEDGSIKGCHAINFHEYDGFEYATCRVLKRARFQPAQDAHGNPTAAPFVVSVRFRMED